MQLSLLICAHDMERELPRTVESLSPGRQRGVEAQDYELIVLDHGSARPVDEAALRRLAPNLRVIRVAPPTPVSPVAAINRAMATARGPYLGLMIDGARIASPGLIATALLALRADASRVVGSLGFHLGPDVQMNSVFAGYDQAVEDALLASVPWQQDGYRLFDISVLAGSSAKGWLAPMAESNALFLAAGLWHSLGGLDTRFASPGGGLANLEFWARAVAASADEPWVMLGEGTFHQVHGGAATNSPAAARGAMLEEYRQIFGHRFQAPAYQSRLIGRLSPALLARHPGQA